MKTKIKILIVGLFFLMGLGISANAQGNHKETANASATAKVIKALTIANTSNLEFGTFAGRNSEASTVVVDINGSRTGTADLIGTDGVAGTFTITGEPGSIVSITLPSATVNLVGTGVAVGGTNMTIGAGTWVTNQVSNSSVTLTADTGIVTLKVGATLAVGAAQQAGPYSGTFSVSVNYN